MEAIKTTYLSTLREPARPEETGIWEVTCPGRLEEVGRVRRWTRDVLSDSPHADDAALIVTELSANALLHSDSGLSRNSFSVTVTCTPQAITITVTDSGGAPTRPHIQHPRRMALQGRGLALVEALADRMEIRKGVHGHAVIATLHNPKPRNNAWDASTATARERQPC
ncbi:ATP-binding protein [Streptomyces odontomachi]|uniref:ATP-binding protein n=1 Tax=Streptomyces odontomachi TaxID=2944940 RepID=UPI002108BDBF|nr:ATP-binding protein [Streptomyces sp. ODS25]